MKRRKEGKTLPENAERTSGLKAGVVCLVFLVLGYQLSLFVHRASVARIVSRSLCPDTVYVYAEGPDSSSVAKSGQNVAAEYQSRKGRYPAAAAGHRGMPGDSMSEYLRSSAKKIVRQEMGRRCESFPFNPNTASIEDFMRLGFSERQALAIDKYRLAGGVFRRPSDFAKSYVVADSVYQRLEKFISIPALDINRADSAAFDTLPGIGPYFASSIVKYRERLGGFSYKEQLMDIYHLDREVYDKFEDLICCSEPSEPFALWTLPEDSLRLHPYIRDRYTAHAIALYRGTMPEDKWTVEDLRKAGVLDNEMARKLASCRIIPPPLE